jgi:signal transduction histidine kinase
VASQSAPKAARPSREWGLWILYYMPLASVVIRYSITVVPQAGFPPVPLGLLAGFLVLSLSVPAIAARYPVLIQPWLFLQTALVSVLILTPPLQDYHAVLFLSLGLVCTKYLRPQTDLVWLVVFCAAASASLMLAFGPAEGLTYLPSYLMGILFLGLYGRARRRAEGARAQSDAAAAELREANEKLRAFAAQAEEMATSQERNRLARELHDAATQTVFSITLTAQAARMACDTDPARLPELLDRIQEAGADALAEMRGLVSELRPRSVAADGLVPTLRQHLALRERRERLRAVLSVDGEETGSVEAKETLLGVAQEALNNVVKHAGVGEAQVALAFGPGEAVLCVSDAGRGFDPAAGAGGFGLASMRQRIQSRGGSWELSSRPGGGTRITVRVPLAAERERDGQEPANQGPDR